ELVLMSDPRDIRQETRIAEELIAAHETSERPELLVRLAGDEAPAILAQPVDACAPVRVVRRNLWMQAPVARREAVADGRTLVHDAFEEERPEHRHRTLDDAVVDEATPAGALRVVDGGHQGERPQEAALDVHVRVAPAGRLPPGEA